MNVDTDGKSVNAIRFFKGKGILVWGSRTLDGASNEWRFVPVRRLFSYVEQSVKLSTNWVVFQPNDSNTWIKVKCQISNFLSTLWRSGAMAGASTDEAYFVEVGEGITMTTDDINRGYLRVRIGLAAVRPAEFIVLEFMHKVQE
jgi:phage tail sheath protein FI